MPLMFESTVSVELHVMVEDCPQLMSDGEAVNAPTVTGATAIVALAVPALKRGWAGNLVPRLQSTVFCAPFFPRSTITFLPATTVTSPDQTVFPFKVTVM